MITAIHWLASTSTPTRRATDPRFHTVINVKTRTEQFAKAGRAVGIDHTMRPFRNRWRHMTADRGSKHCRKTIMPVCFRKRLLRKKSGHGHFRCSNTSSHLHKDVARGKNNLDATSQVTR